jgi:hydrogenase maturation factor
VSAPESVAGHEDHCITCGDDGVPMSVLAVDDASGLALCEDLEGGRSSVETALVTPVSAGSLVLVHAGTAIANLSEAAAGAGAGGSR